MTTEILGQRLQDIRKDHDKSQKDIADVLQIPTPAYSKYERGINMMGVDKYIKLAKYYGTSLDYLLCIIVHPKPISNDKKKIDKEKMFDAYEKIDTDLQKAIRLILKI